MKPSPFRIIVAALALVAVMVAVPASQLAIAQDSTPASTPGVLGDPVDVTVKSDIGKVEVPEGATSFTIDGTQSSASYETRENLSSIGDNDVKGTTNAVAGMLIFDADGVPLAGSRIDVDLRTLATDQAKRDGQVQKVLDTANNPVGTFVVTSVEGLDGALPDGEEVHFTLIGNVTLHGVTKSVAWDATAKLDGDAITGVATTTITFADFDIEKPIIGPVVSIDDNLKLTINLVANKDA